MILDAEEAIPKFSILDPCMLFGPTLDGVISLCLFWTIARM
jgi:hypothetical protein